MTLTKKLLILGVVFVSIIFGIDKVMAPSHTKPTSAQWAAEQKNKIRMQGGTKEEREEREARERYRKMLLSWNLTENNDPITQSRDLMLSKVALGEDPEDGRVLIIACKKNRTQMYITRSEFLGIDAVKVETRLETESMQVRDWPLSSDQTATFYPGSPISFIKRMIGSSDLYARTTPYAENPRLVMFDVSGLDEAIGPIREECGW